VPTFSKDSRAPSAHAQRFTITHWRFVLAAGAMGESSSGALPCGKRLLLKALGLSDHEDGSSGLLRQALLSDVYHRREAGGSDRSDDNCQEDRMSSWTVATPDDEVVSAGQDPSMQHVEASFPASTQKAILSTAVRQVIGDGLCTAIRRHELHSSCKRSLTLNAPGRG